MSVLRYLMNRQTLSSLMDRIENRVAPNENPRPLLEEWREMRRLVEGRP